MPNIHLTKAMQDFAEREVERGAYANVSEVVRAAMRRLMDDDAAAFLALKRELERRMDEPDAPPGVVDRVIARLG